MLVFNLTPQHYFVNIFMKNLSKIKIKVCFMTSIERAVESTIKPFVYLIRKPRNNSTVLWDTTPCIRSKATSLIPHSVRGVSG